MFPVYFHTTNLISLHFQYSLERYRRPLQAALWRRVPPAHPATAPSRKLPVFWPKILLLVRVPPLVQGLKIVLVKYEAARPAATPANPASAAPLPVKNLVLVPPLLLLLPLRLLLGL